MSPTLAALSPVTAIQAEAAMGTATMGTGEAVAFWIIAPLAVLGALGLVLSRKAVHAAMSLAVVMLGLAVLYLVQEAPFLGVVQIVVYTGAIMMVFLFVIMLVGVDASDSRVETIRGQRGASALVVLGLGVLLVSVVARIGFPDPAGMAAAAPDGNVVAVADSIFSRYVWIFEVIAALLITAAVGAMTLTHSEPIRRKRTQRELAELRFRSGDPGNAAGLPVPGVYARHNAVDTPALLPDGTASELSISRVFTARGAVRPYDDLAGDVTDLERQVGRVTGMGTDPKVGGFDSGADPDAYRVVGADAGPEASEPEPDLHDPHAGGTTPADGTEEPGEPDTPDDSDDPREEGER
ncbi:MAG TPA: NADH-quinone oxidoreductase subunit J [Jiangellaceae bacterium]|nr:NADH-quinone oxidoreductase subunit J [Jiangellaceae bacterium]